MLAMTCPAGLAAGRSRRRQRQTWRMLFEEGGRYRAPISKYAEMLRAVTGLSYFGNYYRPYE